MARISFTTTTSCFMTATASRSRLCRSPAWVECSFSLASSYALANATTSFDYLGRECWNSQVVLFTLQTLVLCMPLSSA
ncbi:hypothetical protein EXIGLDRAFT_405256 [Exidia glandulosa HHB12029]|uniref:Uncharacterized protein n=1 Tax=Exidia glandulosa HHB12029 TaxID=1314781 RepID=A0A165KSV0_EXIGL|nr:hypothetical protein EXIGLDRAFT_405256 [Exidia glandulosa HHB12029]